MLAGKVAVVTGAAGSIGAASARRLSEKGASVIVVDLDGEGAEKVAAELPGPAIAVAGDVSREDDVEHYVRAAIDRFGRLDLHHLNAGITGPFVELADLSTEDFDRVTGVNLRGPFLGVRAAFRHYRERGTGGAIVITASIASLRGSHDLLAYQTSKHGVLGLMRGAAMYGGPMGVRVNAVAPGLVPTGLFTAAKDESGGGNDMVQRGTTVPLRRTGTPDEIASVVAFLLSDEAAYVHGEVISVDGGSAMVSTVRPSGGAGAWDTTAVDRRGKEN
ncbi:SDR family NAD(P)-dependent oxidoreductase [Amycolatopsis alkalitolerans]|uniref:Glucose 1-dehydrogenase n=1 Tax=Amycolatopsis alkalitolerans TaxID=2547244 RepID=A0A5C4M806_9PSEU|nr:glucose 1-dehydrogenase [Amycolatopsis alkalitolerans]TNC27810.1 glucose 1-dehydrogenase [Amycolatopsis alkalitolerans]